MKLARTLFISIAILLISQLSYAGGHRALTDGPGEMRALTRMAEKLQLTDTQKQDFAALMELYRPRLKATISRGKADREALLAMAPDSPDYPAMSSKVGKEAGRAAQESVALLAELQGLVYTLLTPEQQVRYMDLGEERREKMLEMRKQGFHGKGHKKDHCGEHSGKPCGHKCAHAGADGQGYCPNHKPAADAAPDAE